MAAVCYLEFSKFAILVNDLCLSVSQLLRTKFCVNRIIIRWYVAPTYYFPEGGRPPFWICKMIFRHVVTNDHSRNQYMYLLAKLNRNRMISDNIISKWGPSAILSFRNLLFWSRDLCLNMILLLHIKFCVNRTINRSDIAKRILNIAAVGHFELPKFWYFVTWPSWNWNLHRLTK